MFFTHAIIWCSRGFLFYVIFTCGRHHFISNLPSSKARHCSIISLNFIEKLRFIYFEWILIQKYASPFGYMEERLFQNKTRVAIYDIGIPMSLLVNILTRKIVNFFIKTSNQIIGEFCINKSPILYFLIPYNSSFSNKRRENLWNWYTCN